MARVEAPQSTISGHPSWFTCGRVSSRQASVSVGARSLPPASIDTLLVLQRNSKSISPCLGSYVGCYEILEMGVPGHVRKIAKTEEQCVSVSSGLTNQF